LSNYLGQDVSLLGPNIVLRTNNNNQRFINKAVWLDPSYNRQEITPPLSCEKEFQKLKRISCQLISCYPTIALGVLHEWRQIPLMVSWLASPSTRKDTQWHSVYVPKFYLSLGQLSANVDEIGMVRGRSPVSRVNNCGSNGCSIPNHRPSASGKSGSESLEGQRECQER
jgi:hypothetical protein